MNDFNSIVDRRVVPTEKWSGEKLKTYFGRDDLLPLWVADMDFKVSKFLIDDLVNRAEHGIFGYEYRDKEHHKALIDWYKRRYEWKIDEHDLYYAPSILAAISILVDLLTEKGDGIVIQTPVYYPFSKIIKSHGRVPVKNSLKLVDGRYEIDFDDLEKKTNDPNVKLMIISNPHNPVGRVWSKDELKKVGEICKRNNVFIISDEIHGDMVYKDSKYSPLLSISEEFNDISAVCLSPGKTFNISGISTAAVIIPNDTVAQKYREFTERYFINHVNSFSAAAFKSAYNKGEKWFEELLIYIEENLKFLKEYIKENIPVINIIEPEGTYLVWLDFRKVNMDAKELQKYIVEEGKLAFDFGHWFGREGAGFMRINIACPRKILEEALQRLTTAVNNLKNID